MLHAVTITVEIQTHDSSHLFATPGTPGPIVTKKIVTFWGGGRDFREAVDAAHSQLTTFLQSDGAKIGSVDSPKIVTANEEKH